MQVLKINQSAYNGAGKAWVLANEDNVVIQLIKMNAYPVCTIAQAKQEAGVSRWCKLAERVERARNDAQFLNHRAKSKKYLESIAEKIGGRVLSGVASCGEFVVTN